MGEDELVCVVILLGDVERLEIRVISLSILVLVALRPDFKESTSAASLSTRL